MRVVKARVEERALSLGLLRELKMLNIRAGCICWCSLRGGLAGKPSQVKIHLLACAYIVQNRIVVKKMGSILMTHLTSST